MTFVNKSPKWIATYVEDTPGPGSYTISPSKRQTMPKSCFLSKTVREEHRKQSDDTLGPGTYNLQKVYNNQESSQAVFKSKISRFTSKQEKKAQDKYQMEKRFIELLNYAGHQKKIPGKLVSLNQRRELEKKIMPQVLPSIPTNQTSYGYRYDQNCKRLVQNQNPKIIFANATSSTKEDFYFQRTRSYIGKGVHFSIQKNLKRSSPQLKYQVLLPDPTKYQPVSKINLKKTTKIKDKSVFISNEQRFQERNSQIKEILKMQKLKREFKDYLHTQFEIKDIQKLNTKQSIQQPQTYIKKGKISQCFLSKIDRFNQKQVLQKDKLKVDQLKIVEKSAQKSKLEVEKEKKKQPYDLGESRFKQKGKQNLGPGYYELKMNKQNAAFLNQKESRFKTEDISNYIPGPGSYEVQIPKTKQKEKVPFSRYVCNMERQNHRFSSMQSLYQQVGKQLNYECKAERQTIKKLKGSPQKHQKAHVIFKNNINRIKHLIKKQ